MIEDFLHEGAYRSRRTVWERNGNTDIDWDRTIDQSTPILTRTGTPLYADYRNRAKRDDSEALIRRLQLARVSHAAGTFSKFQLLEEVLGYPTTLRNGSNESPENIGTPEEITTILKRSRGREFSTRNRNLIDLLLLLTNKEQAGTLSTSHVISHLGTAPFENVWEDVCRVTFNNDQKMLDKLKRESRPAWSSADHGLIRTTNMLIPDTICKVDNCDKDKWGIIDAKYYETTPNGGKNTPTGGPSVQDILKEYFYQLLLDGTRAPEKSAANIFMMPSQLNLQSTCGPDQVCSISGDIRFPFLQTLGLGTMGTTANQHFLPIIYAELDACTAFQSYSQVSSIGEVGHQMDPQAILRTLVDYEEKATSIR
ncbi:BsuM intrinsic DNA restriction component [Bifidobacterium animalis subsp. animalis]|nr:BsuM intrinsic DNA restriction component [Bifidobacterium animalis subsp. animalis]